MPAFTPTIAPGRQYPPYWVLTSLLGYTPSRLAQALQTNTAIVRRWAFGHQPNPHHALQLHTLIEQRIADPSYNTHAPREVDHPTHREWMRLTFRLVNEYLAASAPPAKRPRITNLQRAILQLLPARRSFILAQLQPQYSLRSVKRASLELRLKEEHIPGTTDAMWRTTPLTPAPTITPPPLPQTPSTPEYVPPRSPQAERLHTLLTLYLAKAHDKGHTGVDAKELLAFATARGHSRAAVFRAFKDLCLLRECKGFGKDKVTQYALPHTKDTAP